ncbi:GIN domain-containing protein [Mucilaginibacter sp. FT3.2]|uniref:GIN domain-containing protein n=1 Tax=Mucilaginibacter sp. FT3.2 TaxID=2723090 RepID=UPI00161854D5|nr:DUF2807 domain-containing protein [Mucilaginibacter sp. FT3.2]MBB6232510.1 hypothetical protein [Mucilaginibacter sp. FT3.2]
MKTSTKLIIILFTCIPVSLLAYNLLLKNEYNNGNFYRDLYPKNTLDYIPIAQLPAFKHIVIDGSLKIPVDGGFETWMWMARVWVGHNDEKTNTGSRNTISVIKELRSNLITTVKNDTLFISFSVKSKYDNSVRNWNNESDIVRISANNVSSIRANSAKVTIGNNPGSTDSLKLTVADQSHYDVNNLSIKYLNITAADSSYLNIWKNNHVSTLNYSLKGKSSLNIDEHPVQHFNALQVDSAAKIQITGKARLMQKQLQ